MTRKHFEAIAEVLHKHNFTPDSYSQVECELSMSTEAITKGIADVLEQFNPNFDKPKFLKACGLWRV